jgi:hypothetical protein
MSFLRKCWTWIKEKVSLYLAERKEEQAVYKVAYREAKVEAIKAKAEANKEYIIEKAKSRARNGGALKHISTQVKQHLKEVRERNERQHVQQQPPKHWFAEQKP